MQRAGGIRLFAFNVAASPAYRVRLRLATATADQRLSTPSPARPLAPATGEIAVVEAASSAAVAAASAPAAAESALGLRTRLVHDQRATLHLLFVELADRLLRFLVGAHLHEREAAGPAGRHVAHHANAVDLARPAEQFGELIFGRRVWKVADVQSPAHAVTYSCQAARDC